MGAVDLIKSLMGNARRGAIVDDKIFWKES